MKRLFLIVATLFFVVALAGCEGMKGRDIGTVSGGAIGALAGSQIGHGSGTAAAVAGGAIVGGVVGHHVGKKMEKN